MSLTQARAVAGEWIAACRAEHDPVIEWEAQLRRERAEETVREAAIAAEVNQPTAHDAVEQFMARHIYRDGLCEVTYQPAGLDILVPNIGLGSCDAAKSAAPM